MLYCGDFALVCIMGTDCMEYHAVSADVSDASGCGSDGQPRQFFVTNMQGVMGFSVFHHHAFAFEKVWWMNDDGQGLLM